MKFGNAIVSIFVIVLGGLVILQSRNYPIEVSSAPGPGIYPTLLGWALVILGSMLLIQTVISRKKEVKRVDFKGKKPVFIYKLIGVAILYCIVLPFAGFTVTSFLFLVAVSFLLGLKKYKLLVLIPALAITFIVFIFGTLFRVPLPGQTIF